MPSLRFQSQQPKETQQHRVHPLGCRPPNLLRNILKHYCFHCSNKTSAAAAAATAHIRKPCAFAWASPESARTSAWHGGWNRNGSTTTAAAAAAAAAICSHDHKSSECPN